MPGRARSSAGSPATIFYRKGSYRLQITNIRNSSQSLATVLQLSKKKLADMHSHRVGSRQSFSDVPLIEFTLNRNHLVDADLPIIIAFVQESPTVQSLELFGNMLTDVSTTLLAGFLSKTNLQRLKIGDNLFTATGAVALAKGLKGAASHLVQLHVGGNSLSGVGVEAICDACQDNHIESLGLRDIDFDTAGWVAIGRATSSPNAHITELQLKGNRMSEVTLDALLKGSAAHNMLGVAPPSRLTNIAVNNCELTAELMKPFVSWLEQSSQLTTLDIRHNPIKDDGAQMLLELIEKQSAHEPEPTALTLMVAHCDITRQTCEFLGQACLTTMKRLDTLDIGFNPLGEESAISLATVITAASKLEKVLMHHCSLSGDAILHLGSALASHPTIKDVDFSCNYTRTHFEGWCAVVEKASVLEQLSLTDNEITGKGLSDIAHALSKRASPTLVSLQLGGQSRTPPLANAKNPAAHSAVADLLNRNRVAHDSRWGAKETVSVRPPMPQPMYPPPPMHMAHPHMMTPPYGNSPLNSMNHSMHSMHFGFSPITLPMPNMSGYPSVLGSSPMMMTPSGTSSSSSGFLQQQDPVMTVPQGSGYMPHQMQPQQMMFANQPMGQQQQQQQQFYNNMMMSPSMMPPQGMSQQPGMPNMVPPSPQQQQQQPMTMASHQMGAPGMSPQQLTPPGMNQAMTQGLNTHGLNQNMLFHN